MDEINWESRIERRRRRRRIERIVALIWIIVAISCVIWYFTSYTKTPAYVVNKVADDIDNADVEDFNKYVDLTAITTQAYDDLTGDLFKYDTKLSMRERLLFENFYVLIRPQMCQGAIKVINTRIETGKWTLPEEILKGRQLGIDYDLLLERSLIRHTKITGIDNIEHRGKTATADVNVLEEYSKTPFTLKITLTNNDDTGIQIAGSAIEIFGFNWNFPGLSFTLNDNGWKVISIDNYKDYLATVTPILQIDLDSYIDKTADIVVRYNDLFRAEQSNFIVMQRTTNGIMSEEQRTKIVERINNNIIPLLSGRQAELNLVPIPSGANYLASLRRESTAITIQAWKFYAQGLTNNDAVAFGTAESIHKQELAIDQRIDEIIRSSAVARNIPSLP